ncbi:protein FAM24A-like [Meriones unguiculatus]|uniref:protein FAM24A-like n=1 Tax=Meriones unguiculatus TaxID=10047 RepID=UPI000B4F4879|nr:protein FAM24A-like [Meriones unguiculatus]
MTNQFDPRTIIMVIIGAGILAAMFILIGVVLCLYSKIAKALNSSRTARRGDAAVSFVEPHKKLILPKPMAAESFRTFQCCDACSVYADVGSLPPCFCSTSEGL